MSPLERIRVDQKRVEEEIDSIRAQLVALEGRLVRLKNAADVWAEYEVASEPVSPVAQEPAEQPKQTTAAPRGLLDEHSPLYGKSLPEAALFVLKENGEPLAPSTIGVRLKERGWVFSSPNPETTIYWSLRHRSLKEKDVVSVPGSKWALREWDLETPISAKTKEGLVAAVARGQKLGPRPKLTPELAQRLRQMLDDGTSVAEAADALSVSKPTIYRFIHRETFGEKPDLVELARKTVGERLN